MAAFCNSFKSATDSSALVVSILTTCPGISNDGKAVGVADMPNSCCVLFCTVKPFAASSRKPFSILRKFSTSFEYGLNPPSISRSIWLSISRACSCITSAPSTSPFSTTALIEARAFLYKSAERFAPEKDSLPPFSICAHRASHCSENFNASRCAGVISSSASFASSIAWR